MVQHPGLGSPTSDAQAQLLAGAPKLCKPHGVEEKGKKKKKKNRRTDKRNPETNGKCNEFF